MGMSWEIAWGNAGKATRGGTGMLSDRDELVNEGLREDEGKSRVERSNY